VALSVADAQERRRVPEALFGRVQSAGPVSVIVELDVGFEPEGNLAPGLRQEQRGRIAAAQDALASELGGTMNGSARWFRTIPFAALEVGIGGLAALEGSDWVVDVQEDRLHRVSLDVSAPVVEADQAAASGLDGTGQAVVVLDTGADAAHPNLAGKIVDEACFARGNPGPSGDCPNSGAQQFGSGSGTYCTFDPDCFHGTHVAGIAVGLGASFSGVAAGASLIPIQVFSNVQGGAGSWGSDQIAALEHVYDTFRHSHTIASVNMSLGGGAYSDQDQCDSANSAIKTAIDNLRSVGIATAISAGNSGFGSAIGAPACVSSAVSVGATNDNDVVASFSNRASFLSLWAPGVSIRAPLYQTTGFTNASGTSMSAPHVAGTWAILRQAFPSASVSDILGALQLTGVPISDPQAATTRIRIESARVHLLPDCNDGLDNDGDGFVDDTSDPGCDGPSDIDETSPLLVCDDGADNDGDGLVDYPDDPGCASPSYGLEDPQCNDGSDNDGDTFIDLDDPECSDAWDDREAAPRRRCGLGYEIALLLAPIAWLVRRERALCVLNIRPS
jgi:subtilisin family serine protease